MLKSHKITSANGGCETIVTSINLVVIWLRVRDNYTMKLILIHGAPATGKMTVARKLADITEFPLVDNHIAIDLARNIFGFVSPGFWDLVHDVRVATLRAAARAHVPILITTAAYSYPEDIALLEDYERVVSEFNGTVSYVHLYCSKKMLMNRVTAPDRIERGKLSTREGLKKYLAKHSFVAVQREDCIQLSTDDTSPLENARNIAHHYNLMKPS